MASKMRKTLNILYPQEFGKSRNKKSSVGFFRRRWLACKQYLSEVKTPKLIRGGLLLLGTVVGIYTIYTYNRFTTLQQRINVSFGNIQSEVQRRNDLINNLVPPTINYMNYEKDLFSYVVDIRKELTKLDTKLIEPKGEGINIHESVKSQLPALMGIFENYPDLKASKPFGDLMKELIETENRIAKARESMNENIRQYNTYITKIPASVIAKIFDYNLKKFFEATDVALIVPDMKKLGIGTSVLK